VQNLQEGLKRLADLGRPAKRFSLLPLFCMSC
jgi:hypothetical protein